MRTMMIIPAMIIGLLTVVKVKVEDESDRWTGGIVDNKTRLFLLLRTIVEKRM